MSPRRAGLAAGLILVTLLGAIGAYVVLAVLGLGPCDGDGGGPVPNACGELWLVFPVAPLIVATGAGYTYTLRRPWPLGVGLALAVAATAIPYVSITG